MAEDPLTFRVEMLTGLPMWPFFSLGVFEDQLEILILFNTNNDKNSSSRINQIKHTSNDNDNDK